MLRIWQRVVFMKIGMNDPCPCGSGKKYKKCCWNKEYDLKKAMAEFEKFYASFRLENPIMLGLDSVYALLKGYNSELLDKANAPYYIGANFNDAIDLSITSNAISLIKGLFQNNHYSITNALNLRNLIECFTLLSMNEKGDISDTQKMLFNEQYKLIEYESYAKNDSDKYESILNLADLKARYKSGKEKFLEVVGTESKLKRIINSRLPFLCNEKLSYNILLEKYYPLLLQPYIYLSRMVHPSSYASFRDEKYYNIIFWSIMKLVIERYKEKTPNATALTYYKEQALVYGLWVPADDNYGLKLYDLQEKQCQLLKKISKEFQRVYGEESYVKNFLDELALVLHDLNTDAQLGYTENVKLKFKVVAEMFACFHRVYNLDATEDVGYFYDMLNWHDIIKEREQQKKEITNDEKDVIYNRYLKNYSASQLTRDEFFKEYNKQLGFLVDGEGHTPNLVQLVDEYLDKQYKDNLMANNEMKIKDFYKIVYKESNNLSHGCGYLFFANTGAWMDDINVLQFLDNAVTYLLFYVGILFVSFAEESENNKIISDLLKESLVEMRKLVENKMEILNKSGRVPKNF